jgi:hypothetical protein
MTRRAPAYASNDRFPQMAIVEIADVGDSASFQPEFVRRHQAEVPFTRHAGKTYARISVQAYNTAHDLEVLESALLSVGQPRRSWRWAQSHAAGLGAAAARIGAFLHRGALVPGALVGACRADLGAQFGRPRRQARVGRHHFGAQPGDPDGIEAEADALPQIRYLVALQALVGAPRSQLDHLETLVDASLHRLALRPCHRHLAALSAGEYRPVHRSLGQE